MSAKNIKTPPSFPADPRSLLEAAKAFRSEGVERIRSLHVGGATGREVVEKLTDLMDDLLRGIAAAVFGQGPMPFSIIAVGGYSRAELSPGSDVDLLFLCDDADSKEVKIGIEKFLYPLWDLKLDVGHAVREQDISLKLAAQDYTVLTSLLDARTVAGEAERYEKLWSKLRDKTLPKVAKKFVREKFVEIKERRKRFGDSIYLLEPNIKESPGGLRDLHTAMWAAKALHRVRRLEDLEGAGIIPPQDLGRVESAIDFIWTVRNELHFQAKRKEDRLTFQGQERMALFLDYRDRGDHRAVEQFMRDYYLHADALRHFTDRLIHEAIELCDGVPKKVSLGHGLYLSQGEISADDPEHLPSHPVDLLKIFQLAAEHKARLAPMLIHAIQPRLRLAQRIIPGTQNLIRGEISIVSPELSAPLHEFWKLFENKGGISYILEDMHEAGVLGLYLPEFEALRRQVQHDAYHIYTTDLHSILTVRELEDMRAGRLEKELPLFTDVARQIEDWPLLLLTGLFHDVGKGVGKNHAERGAAMMPAISQRLGLTEDQGETLTFLIRNHLEMAQASQKRDVTDPALVTRFAKVIAGEQYLKMLALLTVADQRAVGPEGWSDWKGILLADLYVKALRVLEKGAESWAEIQSRRDRIRKSLTEILRNDMPQDRIEFNLTSMPQRFFLTRTRENIARCLRVIEQITDKQIFKLQHLVEPNGRTTELIVCTWDASGLFSKIAGVLSSNGVNILSADIYTRTDGAVLDIFHVNDPTGEPVHDTKWIKIETDLLSALTGTLNVATRITRKKPLLTGRKPPYRAPRVEFDLDSSDICTIIEVYAHDRVGLLFDITSTLTKLGLYIDRAIIATEVDQAADVFYVKDIFGTRINEPDKLKRIKEQILAMLKETDV